MAFSCIIVDDDACSIDQLKDYIALVPSLNLIKTFTDPLLALKEIGSLKKPIDFLFTDVEMPNLNGLSLAQQVCHNINNLILVSGHLKYATDGYDIDAKMFLSKPVSFKKFEANINNLIKKNSFENPFIILKLSGPNKFLKLYIDNIIAIEGASNYIKIHTVDKILVPYKKLLSIENELKEYSTFRRISKSVIISIKHIEKTEGYNIYLKKDLCFSVGESYKKDFRTNLLKGFIS